MASLGFVALCMMVLPMHGTDLSEGEDGTCMLSLGRRSSVTLESFYGYRSRFQSKELKKIVLDMPSQEPLYNLAEEKADMSFAQFGQDKIIWPLFKGKTKGFFVESGARDGESHSNTILFESKGWQGLLVEPGEEYQKIASKHRKAWAFHGAISPTTESETLKFQDSADGLSHLDSVDLDKKPREFDVQAEPLEKLLQSADPVQNTVDFWSLDVEGSEGPILESTDFTKIMVGVLMIEMNKSEENNKRILNVMEKNGFIDIGRTMGAVEYLDHVFINPKYFDKQGLPVPKRGEVTGLF